MRDRQVKVFYAVYISFNLHSTDTCPHSSRHLYVISICRSDTYTSQHDISVLDGGIFNRPDCHQSARAANQLVVSILTDACRQVHLLFVRTMTILGM
jgi:hypothetical protein